MEINRTFVRYNADTDKAKVKALEDHDWNLKWDYYDDDERDQDY